MRIIKFFDFLDKVFNKEKTINLKSFSYDWTNTYIEAFAMFVVVETIAAMMANIEFKTYKGGKEFRGEEWYSMNIRPNRTQNSSEFWQEFWCRLLYDQEVLVIQDTSGRRIIADGFSSENISSDEKRFTNVSRNGFLIPGEFFTEDVWYLKYANNNISFITNDIFRMYNEMVSQAKNKYARNAGEKGILEVDALASNDKDFEKRFSNLMNNHFKNYFSNANSVVPLFNGMKYTPTSTQTQRTISEVTDVNNIIADAVSRVAQIYKISPALVKGEAVGIKEALDASLTTCFDPLANMAAEELTSKQFSKRDVLKNDYIRADTSCIKHFDIFDSSTSIDKLISCGSVNVNEIRQLIGMQRIDEPWADAHYITKNYEAADRLFKGGENNANVGN